MRVAAGIYSEGTFLANCPFSTLIQSYREGDWKLILDRLRDTKELYNVREDPLENATFSPSSQRQRPGCTVRSADTTAATSTSFRDRARSKASREKTWELRSPGYVGGQTRSVGGSE
jgi:hypothetical protein